MNYPKFKVCLRCYTYNQASFITDALNGFCMQQTDFPYVCCVVDDASTDGEQEVIRKYVEEHFDLSDEPVAYQKETEYAYIAFAQHKTNRNCYFAVLYLKENHYSNPALKSKKMQYLSEWRDNVEYEALCEGDDYWLTADKLQKQTDWLETHPEYSAIASNSKLISPKGDFLGFFSAKETRSLSNMGEIVRRRQFHTASVLYRQIARERSIYSQADKHWDTLLWCCLMSQGPIFYQNTVTCVYRKGVGVVATTDKVIWCTIVEEWANILYMLFGGKQLSHRDTYYSPLVDVLNQLFCRHSCQEYRQLLVILMRHISVPLFFSLFPVAKRNIRRILLECSNRIIANDVEVR